MQTLLQIYQKVFVEIQITHNIEIAKLVSSIAYFRKINFFLSFLQLKLGHFI